MKQETLSYRFCVSVIMSNLNKFLGVFLMEREVGQWKERSCPFSEVNFFGCRGENQSCDIVTVKAGHNPGNREHIFINV